MESRSHYEKSSDECLANVSPTDPVFAGAFTEPGRNSALLTLWLPRITSLRLIQPRIDIQAAAQAALSFEHKAFVKANEKVRPIASISSPSHRTCILILR